MDGHRYAGMTVAEILPLKKASIQSAPLPAGSPSWDDILDLTWEELDSEAQAGKPGFKTIRKLLSDTRFDK